MLGKIFGAGLGWILMGGPIGAIIGLAIGSAIDKKSTAFLGSGDDDKIGGRHKTQKGDFTAALIVVSAAMMKADGKVLKSELDYVKRYFLKNFGTEVTNEKIKVLGEVLKQEIPLDEVCEQIKYHMRIAEKRLLLQYIFGISAADGEIAQSEMAMIESIAVNIGISEFEFQSMRAMFTQQYNRYSNAHSHQQSNYQQRRPKRDNGPSLDTCYQIIGVSSSATENELKKAYRKLAVKYHPDKVAHLGEAHVKTAEDKFQKVQEAYEKIKDSRGLN